MTSGSIDQPIAKLKRAAEHYRVIKSDVLGGYDRQTWSATPVASQDGLQYRLRAGDVEPLPPELPLIFGDAYFNLRASLDYLVYQMHVRHFRGRVSADVTEQSAFPIRGRQPLDGRRNPLPTSSWTQISHLAQRERKAIEWLQPYQRVGNSRVKDLRSALADIGMLNNIDKHRELHVARNVIQAVEVPNFAPELGFHQSPAFGITLETGTYIDTWTFNQPPPPTQMERNFRFRAAIGIEVGGDRLEEPFHLGGSILAVDLIIKRFSHLFPPASEPLDLSWVRMRIAPLPSQIAN